MERLMVSQLKPSLLSVVSPAKPSQPLPTVEGLVQIFTASQRGFFTSVMSQALRLAGQGTSVLVIQFLKGGCQQGPDHPIRLGQNLEWVRLGVPRCLDTPQVDDSDAIALKELWAFAIDAIDSGRYELVVLDELTLAVDFGLIAEAEVVELLRHRPRHIDVILTGPRVSESLLAIADQITELRRGSRY